MEREKYQELEDRRRMLQLLYDKLEEARSKGETSLELYVYQLSPQSGIAEHGPATNSIGEELNMSGPHAVALFKRLRDRHLIGRLHSSKPMIPFFVAQLEDLSDEGMRMIDLLPQEQLFELFREVIAVAEDPETPGTPEQKRAVIEWLNSGIGLTRNVTWLADKLTDVM